MCTTWKKFITTKQTANKTKTKEELAGFCYDCVSVFSTKLSTVLTGYNLNHSLFIHHNVCTCIPLMKILKGHSQDEKHVKKLKKRSLLRI